MKAQVYVNRHIMAANKKATKEQKQTIDNAAVSVNTYLGSIYGKEIEFTKGCKLVQDATNARCSGATIWLEAEFESLVIDGVKADRAIFAQDKHKYMSESQNIPEHIDAAVSEFLDKLASIDDYVRPAWELEIKEEIWEKFEINTQSERSMFDLEIAKIRNPQK